MRSFLSSTSSSSNVRTKAIVMNTTTTSSSSSIKQKSKQVSKAIRRQKTNLIHHPSSSSSNEERRFKSMLTVSASTAANDVVATNDSNNKETFEYQAEVNRLMDLIVNSLYSNKDVFLRELISNASDACDKLRFRSVQEPELMNGQSITDLRIKLKGSSDLSSLTIEDNGIGMSKDELIANLGTIANSGTSKVMEMLKKQNADKSSGENLIGKFGVGFYSSFLVADAVKVTSKSNDDQKAWTWESLVNSSSYTIREATEEEAKDLVRGTRISLKLKDD